MSETWESSRSTVRLETDGANERLHVDYVIHVTESTRKNILLRRAFSILSEEEHRLWNLSDQKAIEELDALKASQDKQFVKKLDS